MSVKLLTEHRLEFVSLKGVYTRQNATLCRGSIYDILASNRCVRRKGKIQTSTTNLVFHACSAPFHAPVH